MPDAVSPPPRSVLPRDVDIPVLPGVGSTGYGRGGSYWRRRQCWNAPALPGRPAAAMAERLRERGYGAQAG